MNALHCLVLARACCGASPSLFGPLVSPAGLSQSEGAREGVKAGAFAPDSPEYRQEDPNAGLGAPAFAGWGCCRCYYTG
jgi:hypothetical protein